MEGIIDWAIEHTSNPIIIYTVIVLSFAVFFYSLIFDSEDVNDNPHKKSPREELRDLKPKQVKKLIITLVTLFLVGLFLMLLFAV